MGNAPPGPPASTLWAPVISGTDHGPDSSVTVSAICGTVPALGSHDPADAGSPPGGTPMQYRYSALVLVPALMLAAACSKDSRVAADTSLNNDLSLASQARSAS